MKIMFGRYKGQDIRNVPKDYLLWLVKLPDLRSDLRDEIKALLARYASMQKGAAR